jgi:competence protein ComEA
MVQPLRPQSTTPRTLFQYDVSQQTTLTHPLVSDENIRDTVQDVTFLSPTPELKEIEAEPTPQYMSLFKSASVSRIIAVSLVIGLIIGLYLLWRPSTAPASSTTVQSADIATIGSTMSATVEVSTPTTVATDANTSGTTIQVYIVGAVQHPGVYTVDSQARVYQLLQKAGGPISTADLASLNLAARLSDGQEVYVLRIGETPVASTNNSTSTSTSSTGVTANSTNVATTPGVGAQVNINTASVDELKQQLSVSSKTAETIINYRQQHGPFTSTDTLAQIVSQSIYKKIKDKVTVQ